ncbi:MAG: proline dehydrogenase family protein [Saprospiraceae bacterium]|jgi:proline dehydrogenase|nr:proline dehydrogenase family protein [Saprospiraceae bacterium]MBL0024818.1 proline dehydrogenase family protein [Saprospiraceae bacterium]
MIEPEPTFQLDFSNTEIAFSNKSDRVLKKTAWLFRLMNNPTLVDFGSKIGLIAIKLRLPFTDLMVRNTIFPQFCGGESLLDCQKTIDNLYESDILTVLDFGAEGKCDEEDLDAVMEETLRAVEMAASNNSVPVVSTKITGLVDKKILEKIQNNETLSEGEKRKYQHLQERLDEICEKAQELGISIFVDSEESWIQDPIDELVMQMSEKYNKERATIYNTYQLYLKSKLAHIKRDHERCQKHGIIFGCKMVRGAYMDKERNRAEEMGYPSPIQDDKKSTDDDFNSAIEYCVENYTTISSCCASHNMESNMLQAKLIHEKGIDHNHQHINFCQLYGMSDNITYNLANAGYNAAKYVVYGPIKDVIPYLIRRTQENASVTGDMSRELSLIESEVKRRGI